MTNISRRDLLKTTLAATITASLAGPVTAESAPMAKSMIGIPFEKRDKVRLGIVGVGERGKSMIHDFLGIEHLDPVVSGVRDVEDAPVSGNQQSRRLVELRGRLPHAAAWGARRALGGCAAARRSVGRRTLRGGPRW